MLKVIARIQLRGLCRFARRASGPFPANDNLRVHNVGRSIRPRLFCRWSTDDDGLVCHWSEEMTVAPGLPRQWSASEPLQTSWIGSGA